MSIRHFFVPNPIHKKRAVLLRHPFLLSYVFFLSALFISSYLIIVSIPNVLGYATNVSVSDLLQYTNSRRSDARVGSVSINETLSKAAHAKAQDMFAHNYWAHTSPQGKEPWDFITAAGYDYLYAGENLAVDFSDSKDVVDAWYESPSHKANLLSSHYTDIGFAVVNGELEGRKTTLIVQMFGYPRGARLAQAPPAVAKKPEVVKTPEVTPVTSPGEVVPQSESVPASEQTVPAQAAPNNPTAPAVPVEILTQPVYPPTVLQAATVYNASRSIAVLLGFFVSILFAIDGYYVRRFGILRVSGHSLFHIVLLMLAIIGIWYTNIGLVL